MNFRNKLQRFSVEKLTREDAVLDGFHGRVEEMKLALIEMSGDRMGSCHKDYWQIFYDPGWVNP